MVDICIGKYENTKEKLIINLDELIDTRLLIQANSGGGKSYLIRKLLEESHGKIQQIVLDLEGEFATLREKYDFLLVGKDGDVPINLRSSELLARKLLELNISVIIDLSELKKHERMLFVKRFLDSMVDSPKKLWHPVLVILDEAHQFAPEKTKSESVSAVIDLCTRGRKRGFCAVLATQRLSKLNKDASAECNNKLIGRTGLDIDRKRASDELGFTTKEQNLSLRTLNAGEFYAFGSAISMKVDLVMIGKVKTKHPKRGEHLSGKITPPTKRVKALLKKITDLPKEAEKELKTKEDMKKEITRLKIELRKKNATKEISPERLEAIHDKGYNKGFNEAKRQTDKIYKQEINNLQKIINKLDSTLKTIATKFKNFAVDYSSLLNVDLPKIEVNQIKSDKIRPVKNNSKPIITKPIRDLRTDTYVDEDVKVTGGAMRMLKACAMFYPKEISKARMGAIAGLSYKSGSFGTYLATLKRGGLIEGHGNSLTITDKGLEVAGDIEQMPTDPESLIKKWCGIVKGGASRMLRALADAYPNSLSREELGEMAGISSISGTFGTYLATLKRNGLIKVHGKEIKASEELFEDV